MEHSTFYEPLSLFRQPAINLKKTRVASTDDGSQSIRNYKRSWQTNTKRLGSPTLRKISEELEDFYTTKRLQSKYWNVSNENKTTNSKSKTIPSGISIDGDNLVITNMDSTDNLKLFSISKTFDGDDDTVRLHKLQSISVPGKPIISSAIYPHGDSYEQLILTGHQDGYVNLISTSTDRNSETNAKIIKRFNHSKFLTKLPTKADHDISTLLESHSSNPVKKVLPWSNDKGFTSLINNSLFIYDLEKSTSPQFLQSFPGVESFATNHLTSYIIALCGSNFDNSGISLLDLRSPSSTTTTNNLYTPKLPNRLQHNRPIKSLACEWIDEFTIAQCFNDTVKIWDIRNNDEPICDILPQRGIVESIVYDESKKILYSCDDFNNLISWDLTHSNKVDKLTLAQGWDSIQKDMDSVSQCGNFLFNSNNVKSNGPILMENSSTLNGLITLSLEELGIHEICEVKHPITNDLAQYEITHEKEDATEDVSLDSSSTIVGTLDHDYVDSGAETNQMSLFSTSIPSDLDDSSSIEIAHETSSSGQVKPIIPNKINDITGIYSLNKLSGSTIQL